MRAPRLNEKSWGPIWAYVMVIGGILVIVKLIIEAL